MSENQNNDEILDRNVGELLRRRHEPPVIDAAASARILLALEERLPRPETSKESTGATGERTGLFARLFARPLHAGLAAAVAAAAIVAGGVALNQNERLAVTIDATGEYENTGARPQRIELADGSVLTLRSGAHVRMTGKRSAVLVTGDAIFDIARDASAPFTIARPGSESRVVVLGTRFVLRGTDAGTMAAVIRGSVRLEGKGGKLELGAGEGGELPADGTPVRRPVPRLSHLVSWSRSARGRSEGKDPKAARQGNLIARFAGWDGQDYPLPVRDFSIDVHLENQVARVAIDQTFFNEYPGQLEGIYSFKLPGDAAISRMAMYVEGKLMEAGIAERARARQVYESIVYRRRDPALMEWMAGNEVKVRIFPLFGRQEKRILLSYTQSLERLYDDVQLTIPLPRLDRPVGALNLNARLVGCAECEVVSTSHAIKTTPDGQDLVVTLGEKAHTIEDDLLITIRQPVSGARVVAQREGAHELALARVVPDLETPTNRGARKPRRWVLLHDTSASRSAIERAAQVHVVDRLLRELDETDQIAVMAFDATVRRMKDADNAFTSVANADRKGIHDFLVREGRDGVGYTDLAAGLRAAADLLAGADDAASFEPFVIYLGDGVATGGDRGTRELLAGVKGRAAVVSIAVGASQDTTVLGVLASETGGMTTVLNPGEDLDWRVFDLVAALNTDRVTGLRAELLGLPATPGVGGVIRGPRAVAVPEEPEVYLSARELATGDELSIVTRTLGALPAAVRLRGVRAGVEWSMEVPIEGAQGLTRGARYLPRLRARERIAALLASEEPATHKAAITALGLEHWLLTPHTSLLVLENDAAYAKYKVVRSSAEGWAAYKTPAAIKVVKEPLTAGVNLATSNVKSLVFRAPFELFFSSVPSYRMQNNGWGTIGAGRFGFIGGMRGGGGLGVSGISSGALISGDFADRSSILPDESRQARRERSPASAGNEEADNKLFEAQAIVTGKSANQPAFRVAAAESRRFGGADKSKSRGPSLHRGLDASGLPVRPMALHYSGDPRLRDLTALVPALFSAKLDRERERLVRGEKRERLAVAAAAAAAIDRARGLLGRRRYTLADGTTARVDSAGRFRIERRTFTGLEETLVYDGDSLTTHYRGLQLAVTRDIGDAEPLLYEAHLPFFLARPERLARFYTISGDAGAVTLQAPKLSWKIVIRFDDTGRLVSMSRVDGAVDSSILAIRYEDGGIVVSRGESKRRYAVTAASDSITADTSPTVTTVAMPLRHPAFVLAEIERAATGDKRRHQAQLAASYAALGRVKELGELAVSMAKDAALSPGELVLVSSSVVALAAKDVGRVVPRSAGPTALRDYLLASRRFGTSSTSGSAFAAVARDPSWFGTIALYRQVLALATRYNQRGRVPGLREGLTSLRERRVGPELIYILASMYAQNNQWSSAAQVAEVWRLLADDLEGGWGLAARVQRARSLGTARKNLEAAAVWSALVKEAIAAGLVAPIDWSTRNAFLASPRGPAGWQAFWATTRDRVLARRDPAQLAGLLRVALSVGQQKDAARIATTAAAGELTTEQRLEMVQLLQVHGQRDIAFSLFEPLRKSLEAGTAESADPGVYQLASSFAAARGDKLEAARLYRLSLERSGESTPLRQVRLEYANLIRLYQEGAILAVGPARQSAREKLLEAAAEWRGLDPDNAAIDNQVSTALFALGEDAEAMRVLSTAIERHPMEGRSFEVVATVLQSQGNLETAISMWERAVRVEPENPTWLLRQAQARVASGDNAGAKALLDEVAAKRKRYHVRFEWIVRQAMDVRRQLK